MLLIYSLKFNHSVFLNIFLWHNKSRQKYLEKWKISAIIHPLVAMFQHILSHIVTWEFHDIKLHMRIPDNEAKYEKREGQVQEMQSTLGKLNVYDY